MSFVRVLYLSEEGEMTGLILYQKGVDLEINYEEGGKLLPKRNYSMT